MVYIRLAFTFSLLFATGFLLARAKRTPIPRDQVPKLIQDLKSSNLRARCNAAANLDYTEDPAKVKKQFNTFIKLARTGDDCEKGAAIETLSKLFPDSEEGLDAALSLLDSSNIDLHWRAANAIIAFVCHPRKTIKLVTLAKHYRKHKMKNYEINTRLLNAISCYGKESYPLIKAELQSDDRSVQFQAIQLLKNMVRATSKREFKMEVFETLKKLKPAPENKDIWKATIKALEYDLKALK